MAAQPHTSKTIPMTRGILDGLSTYTVSQARQRCRFRYGMRALTPDLPLDIVRVDHVAWATWDVTDQARLLTEVLGGTFVDGGDDPGFRWLQFQLPGGPRRSGAETFKIELVEPTSRDGFLYRFLMKRGEGMHHVTLYVRDLQESIERVRIAGYSPVDINLHSEHWKEAL